MNPSSVAQLTLKKEVTPKNRGQDLVRDFFHKSESNSRTLPLVVKSQSNRDGGRDTVSWPEWPTITNCNIGPPIREYLSVATKQIAISPNGSGGASGLSRRSKVRPARAMQKFVSNESHQATERTTVTVDLLPGYIHDDSSSICYIRRCKQFPPGAESPAPPPECISPTRGYCGFSSLCIKNEWALR